MGDRSRDETTRNSPECVGVTKQFGSFTALDDSSFVVQKVHIHQFMGPNGAAKSTTIKLLMDFKAGVLIY